MDNENTPSSGQTVPAGDGHDYYRPNPLPPQFTPSDVLEELTTECVHELEKTHRAIQAQADQEAIVDEALWLEARGSSGIEGIPGKYATVPLNPDTGRADIPLVNANHNMLHSARAHIHGREDITADTVHNLHELLNDAETSRDSLPSEKVGVYREHGVYIPTGANSAFRPVPSGQVPSQMNDLYECLATDESQYHWLVDAAITHHQFETIHPYADGNGRVGRGVFLAQVLAESPFDTVCTAPSQELLSRREEYYTGFQQVRQEGAWEEWCLLLIESIRDTAVSLREEVIEER